MAVQNSLLEKFSGKFRRCWKIIHRFSGSTKCYPCQGLGIFRQVKWLLENRPRLRERSWIFSSETATAFLSFSESNRLKANQGYRHLCGHRVDNRMTHRPRRTDSEMVLSWNCRAQSGRPLTRCLMQHLYDSPVAVPEGSTATPMRIITLLSMVPLPKLPEFSKEREDLLNCGASGLVVLKKIQGEA